jgi:hypothetical protein
VLHSISSSSKLFVVTMNRCIPGIPPKVDYRTRRARARTGKKIVTAGARAQLVFTTVIRRRTAMGIGFTRFGSESDFEYCSAEVGASTIPIDFAAWLNPWYRPQ